MCAMTQQLSADYRLPTTATPEHYQVRLEPDLVTSTFQGEETITVTVTEPVSTLVLNALDLEVDEPRIWQDGGGPIEGSATIDAENERVRLEFPQVLAPGRWNLSLRFRGTLNGKLAGFYRSSYRDASGAEHVLASTQFESTDARRAFPCWDEPALKATFAITLTIEEPLEAISNGPAIRVEPAPTPGKKNVVFGETIRMSTYLVAFVVGDFVATDPAVAAGVPLRVWAVRGKEHLSTYARDAGVFALSFFADYYGIAYPGAKLDLIAIPDFAAGAMENFGAVTFRETALLVDEQTATKGELERVAVVVAHELAHMWFGDLVTMRWWNGIWLNEAFATFMEMLAVDAWKPEWETWLSFGADRAGALLIDGLQSTRPIEFEVQRPDEARAMFDVLTYQKGAAVLRMLQQYLGEETFRRGVGEYLREHAYANTETGDLWDALERASGQPVRRTMDSWIFQEGYPLVSVEPANSGALNLTQQRFLYLGDGEARSTLWQVPVILRSSADGKTEEQRLLLSEGRATAPVPASVDWVVANAGGHGFYRVRYARDLFDRLLPHVQSALTPIERLNLLSDTWAATLAGYTPLTDFLDLTALYRQEKDETVWLMLAGVFSSLRRMMGEGEREAIAALVRDRMRPIQQQLGWDARPEDSDRTRELRGMVLSTLGVLGDEPGIREEAERRYAAYLQDRSSVDPNIVPALVSILAAGGGPERYDEFWRAFKTAATPQEEQRYLFALAGFRDPALLDRTLAHTIDEEVRSQDQPYLLRAVMANKTGSEPAWAFMKQHWDTMMERYPESGITRMCEGVTSLTTPELEEDVRGFFATHRVKQAGKQLDQDLERLHMGVLFRQREAENLRRFRAS
jgi:puromycin-sensitive aminopeptidase